MLLHDMSDPFMESAKIFLYAKQQKFADLFFVLFSMIFIVTRDFVYPMCIIAPLFYSVEAMQVEYLNVYIGALSTLGLLNLFWSYLILSMIQRHLVKGNIEGDIREENSTR